MGSTCSPKEGNTSTLDEPMASAGDFGSQLADSVGVARGCRSHPHPRQPPATSTASGPASARTAHRDTTYLLGGPAAAAAVAHTPARTSGTIGGSSRTWSGRPGSLLTLAPHRSGRAGSAASGSSTDSFATRRRVPAGPGSQAMATAIPKACLASSAIRCRDVETGPNLGVLAVFPSNGATCRCPLPSTGSRGLNSPASAVL